MLKLGINFDEISDNIDESINLMQSCDIHLGEVRTIGGKNFVFWSDKECDEFKVKLTKSDINLVAAASPLFKWYGTPSDPEIVHDSFGFDARLNETEKLAVISKALRNASRLGISRVRIFSNLGIPSEKSIREFASSPLIAHALKLADHYSIDLYLENEPVCTVNKIADYLTVFNLIKHPRFKAWLDIANFVELGEKIDENFLNKIAPRVGYVHVKDFTVKNNNKIYVPVGEGTIDYATILSQIARICQEDIIVTVETHASIDKESASRRSLVATSKIIKEINKRGNSK